jgi:AraC family transcriptional regulator
LKERLHTFCSTDKKPLPKLRSTADSQVLLHSQDYSKKFTVINASELRKSKIKYEIKLEEINSKNRIALSKNRKEWEISTSYFGSTIHNKIWSVKMKKGLKANVEVKELPEMNVAYVRHIGPYKGNPELFEKLFTKLMTWAGPRGLINFPESKVLAVYHDDPSVTDESKLRLSACLSVPKDTEVNGEIGKMTIIGGKYAVAKFELANDEYPEAWSWFTAGGCLKAVTNA